MALKQNTLQIQSGGVISATDVMWRRQQDQVLTLIWIPLKQRGVYPHPSL